MAEQEYMTKNHFLFFALALPLWCSPGTRMAAQESEPNIRVIVDMVQLNVAVTDDKGNYITGLRPSDFAIVEDNISQKLATFGEGNQPACRVAEIVNADAKPQANQANQKSATDGGPQTLGSMIAGANVFLLFDTSNYMYRGFVFAQDAIADFVRSLEGADKVAFYSYSRDLSRASLLTSDRAQVLRAARTTVAGDDAALYNCLLLTVQDAAHFTGRKVIVVFSNGPDNYSMVPPEDVAELAQSKGIPIYMISTREAKLEPVSSTVFKRMSAATGGEAYFAKTWKQQQKAFASIRSDLAHLYSVSYYPQPNPNRGWRTITVKLVGDRLRKCRIRTRNGYRPQSGRVAVGMVGPPAESEPAPASSN